MKTKNAVIITAIVTFAATIAFSASVYGIFNSGLLAALGLGTVGDYNSSAVTRAANMIKTVFYKDVDEKTLYKGAINGMLEALDDEYSHFVDEADFKQLTEDLGGKYTGIGINVTVDEEGYITVLSPIEDTPAFKAGINAGDKIIEIDGTPVDAENFQEAVNMMREASADGGNEVTLTLIRADNGETEDVVLIREEITLKTVKSKTLGDNIGYIRITNFDENTGKDFISELEAFGDIGGLVIDLRNNGGGILDSTLEIADYLLPEGLITYFEYRTGDRTEYTSDKDFYDIPMVVLINESTASAAEVLSGALRDHGMATLVGERSFGKGIVQSVLPFMKTKNGETAIYITTSRYFTPSGECIHETGIEPDVQVIMPEEYKYAPVDELTLTQDTQLSEALSILLRETE